MRSLKTSIKEACCETITKDNFVARLENKHNYNENTLQSLTNDLVELLDIKEPIRWIVDTDWIRGIVDDNPAPSKVEHSEYRFIPAITKANNDIVKILEKYHNWFPNKSKISITFENFKSNKK